MFFFRRSRKKRNKPGIEKKVQEYDFEIKPAITYKPSLCDNASFATHISRYIGETVTIFVESGGMSGTGFTGILIYANEVYIKLLTSIGPAPVCPLENPRTLYPLYSIKRFSPYVNPVGELGAFAIIPVNKIISFVHNSI